MATYYVNRATGDDGSDGLDRFGFAVAAGTFTTATKRLVSAGSFQYYTPTGGSFVDSLYITGGTGVVPGVYAIAAKISDDELELVSDIGGTNPSDVTSSDGPWRTPGKLADEVAAGDIGYIQNVGSPGYNEEHGSNDCVMELQTAGTVTAPIQVIGYAVYPGDAGQATFTAGAFATGVSEGSLTGDLFYVFENIHVNETDSGDAWALENCNNVVMRNCSAASSAAMGIHVSESCTLDGCSASLCDDDGINVLNYCSVLRCYSFANAGEQIYVGGGCTVEWCLAYLLPSNGTGLYLAGGPCRVINNTVHGANVANTVALQATGASPVVINNIFSDCAIGVAGWDGQANALKVARNNLFYSCTTNRSHFPVGEGDIESDPLFVSASTFDFRLKQGSPARNAGHPDNMDIGALQTAGGDDGDFITEI